MAFRLGTVAMIAFFMAAPHVVRAQDMVDASGMNQSVPEPSLYADVKACRVGDVLSVIISESNSATKNSSTATKKQDSASLSGEAATGALSGLFPGVGGSMDLNDQYSGQGTTTRNGAITSRISVEVLKVLPNNLLVVEGSKTMEINEDVEVITISGLVRTTDIAPGNTIYSYQIANAKITYKGKGSISQASRPGFIMRVINWLL